MYYTDLYMFGGYIEFAESSVKMVDFLTIINIIKLTEPNTPLNDADHVGSF